MAEKKDPFEKATQIHRGELDSEMPSYEELKQWIYRSPQTHAGGLLRAAVGRCISVGFFKNNDHLRSYVNRLIEIAETPNSMLREEP